MASEHSALPDQHVYADPCACRGSLAVRPGIQVLLAIAGSYNKMPEPFS
jgi:hypothetical protein